MDKEKRRAFIQKVGATTLWSTPIISALTLPSHAQTSVSACMLNSVVLELFPPSGEVSAGDPFRIAVTYEVENLPANSPNASLPVFFDIVLTATGVDSSGRTISSDFVLAIPDLTNTGTFSETVDFDFIVGAFIFDVDTTTTFTNISGPADILIPGSACLLYTSPSPRDLSTSRMPSSA